VIGAGVPALVSAQMSQEALVDWGWRIPFFLGGLVALTSLILRIGLREVVPESTDDQPSPILRALKHHWRAILAMIALMMPVAILYFVIFTYASSYLTGEMHVSTETALDFSTANLVFLALLIVPLGLLADKIGARAVLLAGAGVTLLAAYPLWTMMHSTDLTAVFIGQMLFAGINAVGWALSVTLLAGMVPTAVRCSAVSIGYNTAMAVFGGTTPFVATYLVSRTSDDFAPVYYFVAATLISLVVIVPMARDNKGWGLSARPSGP
ncbi:MAG: MFS transporter, partial [Pseudomonadota bacterium]